MPPPQTSLLIVDDYEPLRAALWELFGKSGYRARCAQDGVSALGEIRQEVPDIVLSDLNMPDMSGFEFLSVVRHRFPAVRVVAMSGEFSGTGVPPGFDADAFFEKGADLGSLKRIVEAITWVGQIASYRTARPPGSCLDSEDRTGPCDGAPWASG